MEHQHYMAMAIEEAKYAAALGETPVGAVVVCGNNVIGRGYNTKETATTPLGHAEINALVDAAKTIESWRLEDCTLYSTLEPCPMCAGAMLQARLKRLVFGAWDIRWGAAGTITNLFVPGLFLHNTEVISGICEQQCQQLLKDFFQRLRENS